MPNTLPHIFCDTVQTVAVHNGVARITLVKLDTEGKTTPTLELLMPEGQVSSILRALQKIVK